jgi:DNA polymerase-3 subunit alpha
VGPGRGSAAGSIVAYILGITQLDPLAFGLMFERFLNPGRRGSYPDIDTDVESDRRGEVIDYIVRRYGPERVSSIVTHSRLHAKTALKDAAKAPDPGGASREPRVRFEEMNALTKGAVDMALDEMAKLSDVATFIERHPDVWRDAQALEGFVRQPGVHAAAVVVAPSDLRDTVGLDCVDGANVCQLDKDDAEAFGLLKLDLLGLETVSLLSRVCGLLGKSYYDLENLPLDDAAVYLSLHAGNGAGIFQFESDAAQRLLKQIRPTNLNELAAVSALNRPGPIESGLVVQYIRNKFAKKREYILPEFETLLAETFGVFVFQEQVMLVAQRVASFSLEKADVMRKAIGKKDHGKMASLEAEFADGAAGNGYDREKIETLWKHILKFADYCFNKSHSVAYSLLSYWAAHLRHYHPREFAAGCLTSRMGDTDFLRGAVPRFAQTVKYCPPDVNAPSIGFRPHGGGVQVGLLAIKGLGDVSRRIVAGAPFKDLGDFCGRVSPDKTQLQKLCLSGALDCFGDRDVVYGNLERAARFGRDAAKNVFASLFDDAAPFALHENLKKPAPRDDGAERECYGFPIFHGFIAKNSWWLGSLAVDIVVGAVIDIRRVYTKAKGEEMAFIKVSTATVEKTLVSFPSSWDQLRGLVYIDRTYAFIGKSETRAYRGKEEENFIIESAVGENAISIREVMVYADSVPKNLPKGKTQLRIVTDTGWQGERYMVEYNENMHRRFLSSGAKVLIYIN